MISIIVATSENNCIGVHGRIPWYLPKDFKHFAKVTTGHKVIMGRSTYESILKHLGKPLPKRENIVITRNRQFEAPGCILAHSLDEAIALAHGDEEIFVIGGALVYKEALPYAARIYRTIVHTTLQGDAFFPELNRSVWRVVGEEFVPKDGDNPFDMTFTIYERSTTL